MQGMGKEWEGTIAKRGRAVFKETGRYSYVALLLLSGAAFGWLGTLLLLVGGSSYYVFGALALFATAALFARRDRRAAYVYGLFLLGTLLWSIDRNGVVEGKSGSVRFELGGRRNIKKKKKN